MCNVFIQQNKQVYFLVGVPRSGTTWLQNMLSAHPDVGSAQESHLFNQLITPMIQQWQTALDFEDGRGGVGLPTYFTNESFDQQVSQFAYDTLAHCPDFVEKPYFIEKTPDHIVHIDSIKRMIPNAKFIYVQRNAHDVIESLLAAGKDWGKNWAPKNVFKAIRLYNNYKRRGEHLLSQLPAQDYHVLSYEDLKAHPEKQLQQVLEFIGLDVPGSQLQQMVNHKPKLKKYGECAKKTGDVVQEPKGFQRKKKGKLTMIQKHFISLFCTSNSQISCIN